MIYDDKYNNLVLGDLNDPRNELNDKFDENDPLNNKEYLFLRSPESVYEQLTDFELHLQHKLLYPQFHNTSLQKKNSKFVLYRDYVQKMKEQKNKKLKNNSQQYQKSRQKQQLNNKNNFVENQDLKKQVYKQQADFFHLKNNPQEFEVEQSGIQYIKPQNQEIQSIQRNLNKMNKSNNSFNANLQIQQIGIQNNLNNNYQNIDSLDLSNYKNQNKFYVVQDVTNSQEDQDAADFIKNYDEIQKKKSDQKDKQSKYNFNYNEQISEQISGEFQQQQQSEDKIQETSQETDMIIDLYNNNEIKTSTQINQQQNNIQQSQQSNYSQRQSKQTYKSQKSNNLLYSSSTNKKKVIVPDLNYDEQFIKINPYNIVNSVNDIKESKQIQQTQNSIIEQKETNLKKNIKQSKSQNQNYLKSENIDFYNQKIGVKQEKQLQKFRKQYQTEDFSKQYQQGKEKRLKDFLKGQKLLQYNYYQGKRREAELKSQLQNYQPQNNKHNIKTKPPILLRSNSQSKLNIEGLKHINRIQSAKNIKNFSSKFIIPLSDKYLENQEEQQELRQQNLTEKQIQDQQNKQRLQVQRMLKAFDDHIYRVQQLNQDEYENNYSNTVHSYFNSSQNSQIYLLKNGDQTIDQIMSENCTPNETSRQKQQFVQFKNQNSMQSQSSNNKYRNHQKMRKIQQQKNQIIKNENQGYSFNLKQPQGTIQFPEWLKKHKQFQNLSQQDWFDMDKKILSICKVETFRRNQAEKELVSMFLSKLPLFQIMPQPLLLDMGGLLVTKSFQEGEYVYKIGEVIDSMYIVYNGQIQIMKKNNDASSFYNAGDHFGKQTIELGETIKYDLKAVKQTNLLCLSRIAFQQCISTSFEQQKHQIRQFIKEIPFFKSHFKQQQIDKLIEFVKMRYYVAGENLYSLGKKTDNFYIVMKGKLLSTVPVQMGSENRWPIKIDGQVKWKKRICSKSVNFTTKYEPQDIAGYYDLIYPNNDFIRTESIDVMEDSFLLYINKIDFFSVFPRDDYEIFEDYHKRKYPTDLMEREKKLNQIEKDHRTYIKAYEDAIRQNLHAYNNNLLDKKANKTLSFLEKNKLQKKYELKKIHPYTLEKPEYTIVNNKYD